MNTAVSRPIRVSLVHLLFLLLSICACVPLSAQEVRLEATATKLKTTVHLRGAMTLAELLTSLSEQTGLKIEPIDYLREHRVVVALDKVSAQTALANLSELNEWVWRETEAGHILVSRPKPIKPQTLDALGIALRTALPKDFRRFLISDPKVRDPYAKLSLPPAGTHVEEQLSSVPYRSTGVSTVNTMLLERSRFIYTILEPNLPYDKPLAIAEMSELQRQKLLEYVTLEALTRCSTFMEQEFLRGETQPYEKDPTSTTISRSENALVIGSFEKHGIHTEFTFFAAPLDYHYEPAPKK